MISPKKHIIPSSKSIKLPEIPSRNKLQSANKKNAPHHILPKIPLPVFKRKLSINKENNNSQDILSLYKKKHSLQENIIQSMNQVQSVKNKVKGILYGLQQTVNIGSDQTNFQFRILKNREYIKRNMNKNVKQKQYDHLQEVDKIKNINFISEKEIDLNEELEDQIQKINIKVKKVTNQNTDQNIEVKKYHKTQRKTQKSQKSIKNTQKNQQIFKSIKQILQNPQKSNITREVKGINKVKLKIQQLENQLKKLNRLELNRSSPNDYKMKQDSLIMKSVKSVGMIPLVQSPLQQMYTVKNWNKVEFNFKGNNEENDCGQIKISKSVKNIAIVKYHKGNFNTEMDHIQQLQMKSYKSIQKMVENRKILIDLQLLNVKKKFNQK